VSLLMSSSYILPSSLLTSSSCHLVPCCLADLMSYAHVLLHRRLVPHVLTSCVIPYYIPAFYTLWSCILWSCGLLSCSLSCCIVSYYCPNQLVMSNLHKVQDHERSPLGRSMAFHTMPWLGNMFFQLHTIIVSH
jgi:hypothetical protein